MRLLHTADWHAGRVLGRQSLDDGLRQALASIVEFAVREKVDAVLVAGDVFDHTRPPAASQEVVYQALLHLWKEKIPVVVIAGNHDSVGHWDAVRPVFQLAGVTISATLHTRSFHTVNTRSGPLHLAALPWPNERLLAPLSMDSSTEESLKMNWAECVRQLVQLLCSQLPSAGPRVLLTHLMLNGATVSCSERALSVSDTYAVSSEIIPSCLNYAALGHVHKPQAMAAPVKACYAGSLRPLDFGEAGHERGFYCVDVFANKPTRAEFVALPPAQELFQVEVHRATMENELASYAQRAGFCKVIVEIDSPELGLADQVRKILPSALIVQTVLKRQGAAGASTGQDKLLDPLETFRLYHQKTYGGEPEAELQQIFQRLLEEDAVETA